MYFFARALFTNSFFFTPACGGYSGGGDGMSDGGGSDQIEKWRGEIRARRGGEGDGEERGDEGATKGAKN